MFEEQATIEQKEREQLATSLTKNRSSVENDNPSRLPGVRTTSAAQHCPLTLSSWIGFHREGRAGATPSGASDYQTDCFLFPVFRQKLLLLCGFLLQIQCHRITSVLGDWHVFAGWGPLLFTFENSAEL